MTRVVVAPPWYSFVITVKASQELRSPWTGWVQVNTGGGSPFNTGSARMLSLLTALSLTQPGPCRLREPLKDKGHVKILWEKFRLLKQFLCRQRWGLVSGEGSDSPALLTAITLNWYHLPSLRPGTRASSSSMVAVQFWSSVIRASN